MIKVENIDVWGFEHAVRGMRNPMNSWEKSDSISVVTGANGRPEIQVRVGEKDLALMRKLYQAGPEHRKYLRQIFVSMDIVAPLYWWKEFDTYKVGTVANSCSTMHKIHSKAFELSDFSHEHLSFHGMNQLDLTIRFLEQHRKEYLKTGDKRWWWQLIQMLPSSYNQRRTLTVNYENVATIIHQRTGHKLDEWRDFCEALRKLPYVNEIMGG